VHPGNGDDVDPIPYLKAATRHLFPARIGARVSVGLRGSLAAAGDGSLELSVDAVRWWPGGRWTEIDTRAVSVVIPTEAAIDADVLALVDGVARRLPSGRSEPLTLTVISTPAAATLAMMRGEPGTLSAARVTKSG
jgi:hypothetical protein